MKLSDLIPDENTQYLFTNNVWAPMSYKQQLREQNRQLANLRDQVNSLEYTITILSVTGSGNPYDNDDPYDVS